MKDKILDIVAEHCVGWKNCEALTEKLFDLYSVSNRRELLVALAKYMEEDKMYARHDEANVDDFLENYSN